jgi:hypothetical protein
MTLTSKEAAAFEAWKLKEVERLRELERKELGILVEKYKTQWGAQQTRITREWEDKEAKILESFTKIEAIVCEYKTATAERQSLRKQLEALEQENDQLKQIPIDNTRQERLVRINNLRLEIQKMEDDLTKSDAELRAANESKNRYKRLFLESNRVVTEMVQEQQQQQRLKQHRRRC